MKTRFFITTVLFAGAMILTNCGKKDSKDEVGQAQEKFNKEIQEAIKNDGINIQSGDSVLKAQKDGEAYTGELWSLDGKTFKMDFQDGLPVGSTTFHKNGKIAIQSKSDSGTEIYFDENGMEMDVDDFFKKYEKYIDEIGEQLESVFARMNK